MSELDSVLVVVSLGVGLNELPVPVPELQIFFVFPLDESVQFIF